MSELTIWRNLRSRSLSEKAVAALMGNMRAESDCFAPRVQGDFTNGYTKSILYTSQVDNGIISRNDFIYHGPGGSGYGLCQWTYPTRKQGLYDLAQRERMSVGDELLQLEWLWTELHQAEFLPVLETLQSDADLRTMVSKIVKRYEMPADQSESAISYRTNNANDILRTFAGTNVGPGIEPNPEIPPEETVPLIERELCTTRHRVLYMGDLGRDVVMLQSGLVDMGYSVGKWGADGAFGNDTYTALRKMQADCNVDENGAAGEATWAVLFQ